MEPSSSDSDSFQKVDTTVLIFFNGGNRDTLGLN